MNGLFDAFVSYGSEDSHLVDGLVRLLRLSGRRIFVAKSSIEPGTLWQESLRQAIANSGQFVLLWCCHSTASSWVGAEIQQAVSANKPIIPLLLCAEPVPEPVSNYQWIDLRYCVAHPCDHARTKLNVNVVDARQMMPQDPNVWGLNREGTLYSPDEYLVMSMAHDATTFAALQSMSRDSRAVAGTVFRAFELLRGPANSDQRE